LSPNAKLLYAEITSLCKKKGYCWAGNAYFAELYEISERTVASWISALKKAGYIFTHYSYKPGKKEIDSRFISIVDMEVVKKSSPRGDQNFTTYGRNLQEVVKNSSKGGDQNFLDNIKDLNNKSSSSSEILKIKEAAAEIPQIDKKEEVDNAQDVLTASTDAPEPSEEEISNLKQFFKQINSQLIFDNTFYHKALNFMTTHDLDSGYISWMYEFCLKKRPLEISGYYYSVFFESRLVELYRESARPAPVFTISCPVCGLDHDDTDQACPQCALEKSHLHFPAEIARQKKLYSLPEDFRKAYEEELTALFKEGAGTNFLESNQKRKILEQKYGLEAG